MVVVVVVVPNQRNRWTVSLSAPATEETALCRSLPLLLLLSLLQLPLPLLLLLLQLLQPPPLPLLLRRLWQKRLRGRRPWSYSKTSCKKHKAASLGNRLHYCVAYRLTRSSRGSASLKNSRHRAGTLKPAKIWPGKRPFHAKHNIPTATRNPEPRPPCAAAQNVLHLPASGLRRLVHDTVSYVLG